MPRLFIDLDDDEKETLEKAARAEGWKTPAAYMHRYGMKAANLWKWKEEDGTPIVSWWHTAAEILIASIGVFALIAVMMAAKNVR